MNDVKQNVEENLHTAVSPLLFPMFVLPVFVSIVGLDGLMAKAYAL